MYKIIFEHRSLDRYVVRIETSKDFEVLSVDYNSVLERYEEFGYSSIGEFVYNIVFNDKNSGVKEYKIAKRNAKYAEKMQRKLFKETKIKIRNEYKLKGINLTSDELEELVYSVVNNDDTYVRFISITDEEKVQLKSILKITKDEMVENIPGINVNKIREIFLSMREFYNFNNWEKVFDCEYRVSQKNRLIVNLNDKKIIMDAFDLFSLVDVDLNYVLDLEKVVCTEYIKFKAQKATYELNQKAIEETELQNVKAVLNDNVRTVYLALMKKGYEVMNSSLFVEDYSVFTYPIKMIMSDLDLEDSKYNLKMVADSINILTTLGIINKISTQRLKDLGREDLIYDNKKGYENNYFYVKQLDMETIEQRAKVLRNDSVRIGHISHKIISTLFSTEFANRVFNKLKESFRLLIENRRSFNFETSNKFGFYEVDDSEEDDDLDLIFRSIPCKS